MKKDLTEIFDTLTPEELDALPEEAFQTEALDNATLTRIQTAVEESTRKVSNRKPKAVRRILAAAACIALLLSAGFGVYAYAAANREYKNALTFFYENELSTEGLTKSEIKEVYRDFYSHSFANDLTTDVLLNSRPDMVRGYEIMGDSSEWDTTLPDTSLSEYKTPVYYEFERVYTDIEGTYNPQTNAYRQQFEESIFRKYHNGEKVWEISFEDIQIYDYYGDPVDDSKPVLVYGTGLSAPDSRDEIVTLIALDTDGTILWETVQNNTPGSDHIDAVLSNPDGSYTTFGRCDTTPEDLNYCLCVNKYDKKGSPLWFKTIDISDHFIKNAVLTNSGYLVHLSSYTAVEFSRVLSLDFEGNLLGDFRYESEENDFFISDLCEHNGTVYISGYSTPKAPAGYRSYYKRDLYGLAEKLRTFNRNKYINNSYTKEELLSMFREHFTAVLLICGPDIGTPQEFYSISGSLGDEIYVAESSICWFTKDIIDSSYSATIDVDQMGGLTITNAEYAALFRFYANIFDADGTFKEQKKLDLMTERHWP